MNQMETLVPCYRQEFNAFRLGGLLCPKWQNVIAHSCAVAAIALKLASLIETHKPIDKELVRLGALLHDVDKRKNIEKGITYANEHESMDRHNIIISAGYSQPVSLAAHHTGRVPAMFTHQKREHEVLLTDEPLEHLAISYADARVRGTKVVSLNEAARQNCVKNPLDTDFYMKTWLPFYKAVESYLSKIAQTSLEEVPLE